MSIVITTPTGQVGSRAVRLLLQAGVLPRLLVRDPERLDPGTRELADVRAGDLTDTDYTRQSLSGADTVFWVDPTPHFVADPIETSLRTAQPLVDAANAGDIARVVLLSSLGAELRHGAGHIDALGQIEERLDATGVAITHLRAGYFFTNLRFQLDSLARGELPTGFLPDRPMAWVDPRDIGEVAAARMLNPEWSGRTVQAVHGPRDLSFIEVAGILSATLDRDIQLRELPDDAVRQALEEAGLPDSAIAGIVGMTAGTRELHPELPREAITTTPTTLEEWSYARLRPLLPLTPPGVARPAAR